MLRGKPEVGFNPRQFRDEGVGDAGRGDEEDQAQNLQRDAAHVAPS
jgi:hypothetical protein